MRKTLLAVLGVALLAGQASAETTADRFATTCKEAVYPDGRMTGQDRISQEAYIGRIHFLASKIGIKGVDDDVLTSMCNVYLHGAIDGVSYVSRDEPSKVAARGK